MRTLILSSFLAFILISLIPVPLHGAVILEIQSIQKISSSEGGFTGLLDDADRFGNHLAAIGDMDGDGVMDMAVGAYLDNDGGPDRGATWILYMNPDGTVKHQQKISQLQGGFTGELADLAKLGTAAPIGDLDGDGVTDLAVGARADHVDGDVLGAVYIFFMYPNGTVKAHQKISTGVGGFTGSLDEGTFFGSSVANLGDLDGDGVVDIAVGSYRDNDGGEWHGAVWILFLNADGTVKAHQKISDTQGGFTGDLDAHDFFGLVVDALGDVDGDGVVDLAVCADGDDDGGPQRGAVWILFLNDNGTVKAHQKISSTTGGFTDVLLDDAWWGSSLAAMGDLDENGVSDLLVQGFDDEQGNTGPGAVWILLLNSDGTVMSHQKLSGTDGSFPALLKPGDRFGSGATPLGDLNGDGEIDLAVGAFGDDDGGSDRGAVFVVFTGPAAPDQIAAGEAMGLPEGNSIPVPISLVNQGNARGLEFTLGDVPDHLTVLDVIPRNRASGMTASFVDRGDEAKILVYDPSGGDIPFGSGPVLDVYVKIHASAEIGDVIDIVVSEALVSYSSGETEAVDTENGMVTVGRRPGDLNGDNRADVGDLVRLVEIILGIGDPPGHEEQVLADCTGDEAINIGDVSCQIDLMLEESPPPVHPTAITDRHELRVQSEVPVKGFQFSVHGGGAWLTSEAEGFAVSYGRGPGRSTTVMAYDLRGEGKTGEAWSPVFFEGHDPEIEDFRAYGAHGEALPVEVSGFEVRVGSSLPARLRMLPSLPNPFRAQTRIRFLSDIHGKARVTVFDIRGRKVSAMPERNVSPGEVVWDWRAVDGTGRDLPAGVYLARVDVNGKRSSIRLTHLGQ